MMKLFITDYDDTLYTNDDSMKENIKMIKKLKKQNFIFAIATGRSYPSIKEKINIYQIPIDYIICCDGSIIYDNKGKIVDMFPINQEIVSSFIIFYQNIKYDEIQFSYPEGYLNNLYRDKKLLGINICINNRLLTKKYINSFLKLKEQYPAYNYLIYTHPTYSYLCIKPQNISKSYAINSLKEKLNIDDNDIYVIGDSSNDLEMIRDFHGVAMKNSSQEVLKIVSKTYLQVFNYINDILDN